MNKAYNDKEDVCFPGLHNLSKCEKIDHHKFRKEYLLFLTARSRAVHYRIHLRAEDLSLAVMPDVKFYATRTDSSFPTICFSTTVSFFQRIQSKTCLLFNAFLR